MKPTRPSRPGLPYRSHLSRTDENHSDKDEHGSETRSERSAAARSSHQATRATHALSREPAGGIEAMRRRMSAALAHKQQMRTSPTAAAGAEPVKQSDDSNPSTSLSATESSSDESIVQRTCSADSASTVKAVAGDLASNSTAGTVCTPSYPFPRMAARLTRGVSHHSGPSHKPFTLLSPTNEPVQVPTVSPRAPGRESSSGLTTPLGRVPTSPPFPEDPSFPTPDLYDAILMLNAEPGVDLWWANVTEILSEAYGAERASLAIPGDITDLENVPWGQKATFNVFGSEGAPPSQMGASIVSEADSALSKRPAVVSRPSHEADVSTPRRPPLQSRHSIAGVVPDAATRGPRHRPPGPVRAYSTAPKETPSPSSAIPSSAIPSSAIPSSATSSPTLPRLTKRPATPLSTSVADSDSLLFKEQTSEAASASLRCHVYRSIQPLEAELSPLLVRTGVAPLLGKRTPVVLTRAYAEQAPSPSPMISAREAYQPALAVPSNTVTDDRKSWKLDEAALPYAVRSFDEFEQPEPSPWSQSPSPSPAARADPSESPFFIQQSVSIDETAFDKDPPQHDYGTTANQSLTAIGAEMSMTLIHIPLIQPVLTRGNMPPSLRFPTAILSFLSPLNPYPRNLRASIHALLPHLATSFSLASQYSSLQDRARGGYATRHGGTFGLGGTFSDEGSELELVAELSGQVASERDRFRSWPAPEGNSPGALKDSPPSSAGGTPLIEQFGLTSGQPTTPARSGSEMVDSYFSARRQRGGQKPTTPGAKPSKDDARQTSKSPEAQSSLSTLGKKSISTAMKSHPNPQSPQPVRTASTTSGSDMGDLSWSIDKLDATPRRYMQRHDSQTRDDGERPLPELISSLMLNAVPLQLFLAKPATGDLVWTNRKFDAFRSQGEARVRDPWQNLHPEDRSGLVKLWQDALRTGSQFTHYIRVKRFNSDSDFRWFVFRASTLLSRDGRLLYWIGSFLDVHEQYMKNLEASEKEAIMAHDTKIRALADAIPQVLFEAIEGEGIVAVNQQWDAYSGQTLEDARGLGFAKHVHRDDLHKCGILSPADAAAIAKCSTPSQQTDSSSDSNRTLNPSLPAQKNLFSPDLSSLDRMIKQGSVVVEKDENGRVSYLTEIRLRSRGGEYRWFLVRLVRVDTGSLQGPSGRASWYGTCTDIETRKALEGQLNEANEKVHSEMESKTKFFANMSHEIRTPLNGILGSMPWLVESALDHDQRRTVDTIQNSANNLRELVDNILDVTKVEAGKMTLLPKWFHVRALCEEVVDTVSSRAIERGLELNYSLEADVPSMVKGDAFRLRQVLLNLLGNSVKFTEQGEVYMRCLLGSGMPSTSSPESVPDSSSSVFLHFEVIDTGRGFEEKDFQRLFQQFGQLGGGSNHEAGSGLGLFLSKQLVEMHGGELRVRSQVGEGSTFSFYIKAELPLPGADVVSHPAPAKPGRPRFSPHVAGSPRSRSDNRTPTLSSTQRVAQTEATVAPRGPAPEVRSPEYLSPALSSPAKSSPAAASPPPLTSDSSAVSLRSNSGIVPVASSASSLVPTPETTSSREVPLPAGDRQALAEKAMSAHPIFRRSKSDNDGSVLTPDMAHPPTYSIIVICPAEHARAAIKQHIEHVVPYQIAVNVTTIPDMNSFLDLMAGPSVPSFTHIVLDMPATSDMMLFMRQMSNFTAPIIPALVVITDHYQKRDIIDDFTALTALGRKAYLVHKPVKPSVFAMIFDPAQVRNLSKDRAREVAQSSSDVFQQVVKMVREKVGDQQHRVLLVEDSDVNRMVIQRYLLKVALACDSAKNGQECVDMVLGHPPGHYSLIICDIQMPVKNGYEACHEIRAWETAHGHAPAPIMALTAHAMPEERAAAATAGFTDYLTKPVDFNVLGTMMMTLLDPTVPHVFLRDRPLES